MTSRFEFEHNLLNLGVNLVAGVDEVGRGPLAGPVVFAAVILDIKTIQRLLVNNDVVGQSQSVNLIAQQYEQINDSKKLTASKRIIIDTFIKEVAISYSIVSFEHDEIDRIGMGPIIKNGFSEAISKLHIKPEYVLTDAVEVNNWPKSQQQNIIKGDTKSLSIGAASIIAKVYRDKLMEDFDAQYPVYGFKQHKGYGTKKHMEAINEYGPCKIHRKSFEPIKSYSSSSGKSTSL